MSSSLSHRNTAAAAAAAAAAANSTNSTGSGNYATTQPQPLTAAATAGSTPNPKKLYPPRSFHALQQQQQYQQHAGNMMTPGNVHSNLSNHNHNSIIMGTLNPAVGSSNNNNSTSHGNNNALFSKHSVVILTVGIMFGYLLLPILMVQHLGFEDLPLMPQQQQHQRNSISNRVNDQMATTIQLQGVHAIGTLKPANQNYEALLLHKPQQQQQQHERQQTINRILFNDDEKNPPVKATTKATTTKKDFTVEELEQTPPEEPKQPEDEDEEEDKEEEESVEKAKPISSGTQQSPPDVKVTPEEIEEAEKREKEMDNSGGASGSASTMDKPGQAQAQSLTTTPKADVNQPIIKTSFNEAEKRIMEDRDILSKQSIPTATSPHIMVTASLPDHHRKKILVTGGAGFVGSHLVDKLMMEGHEVIVVDNFFTGQKKNVAHWLHHPNFRYVSKSHGCAVLRAYV
jgi:hypothetical protein